VIALGIDVGTTHTKVLALDIEQGRTLAIEAAPTPVHRDADGDVRRPADVLDTVLELMTRIIGRLDDATSIVALSVASVGEEVVLLDARQQPVGDTVAWHDPRGFEQAEAYLSGPGAGLTLTRRWPPDATFSLFHLMWLRKRRPDAYRAASSWTDLGDYVLCGLGGEPVMDWTHASRAGAFDLVKRAWDQDSIEAAGLDLAFPRLVASGTVVGSVSAAVSQQTGVPPGVSIVSGGHDHLCAAYGAGLRSTSELFLSAGTSEAHLALVDAPMTGDTGRYRIDQGCYVDAASYYVHVNIHSGHFFKQWRALLYGDTDDQAMYAEIESATTGGETTFELADDLRHARLGGVPYNADRATLMRAILEGLATRSADIVKHLEQASGRPFELILAAGHPTRVPVWKALRLAAYGRRMAAVDEPESAAFGAAVMAAQAVSASGAGELVARRSEWGSGITAPGHDTHRST
jgi:xylulokinase